MMVGNRFENQWVIDRFKECWGMVRVDSIVETTKMNDGRIKGLPTDGRRI